MDTLPKRIAFVVNALTGAELKGGNRDTSTIYSLLTDPKFGACAINSPPPIHQCESRSNFEGVLNNIFANWNVADQLVFYFSGHGELRGNKYCLKLGIAKSDSLPFDNLLNDFNIWNVTKAIIILDTCYSGDATGIKNENPLEDTVNRQTLPKGIAILASSRPGELSRELPDNSSSIFTYLLCDGIRTGLREKPTFDGFITISDIVDFIKQQIEKDEEFAWVTQRPAYSITAADRSVWISKNISGSYSEVKQKFKLVTSVEELKLLYETTLPDSHPCIDASLDDVDWELIEKFSSKIYRKNQLDGLSRENVLKQLHVYSPIPYENKKYLQRSAVLCFTHLPALFYPQAKSIFVVGNYENDMLIRYDVEGPLSKQVELLTEKVKEHLDVISYLGKNGLREERLEIDENLMREIISNAIAHRDYDQSGNVTVVVKPDVLEIKNPGKFPENFSWSLALETGAFGSRPVNIAISYYLSYLLAFEGVGRGLAVIKNYIENNGPDSISIHEYPGPITCVKILRKKQKFKDLDLEKDLVLSDQFKLFINQIGSLNPPPDLVQLRKDYLAHLERSYRALDFKGIPQLRNLTSELLFDDVYVPLLVRPDLPEEWGMMDSRAAGRRLEQDAIPEELFPENERNANTFTPVQIEEALREKTRVVVLGDPGSGKSTMLKYLALRLAKDDSAPLPILLPLNAYARALQQREINLQAYLHEYFAARAEGVASLAPLFREAIEAGKAVIMLDGLDEVQEDRPALVQKVEAFVHDAVQLGNRVLVTSRIVGYRDAPLSPKDWSLYTLLDFTPEAIEAFAGRWCLAFEKGTTGDTPEALKAAHVERDSLLAAIEANPGVGRLASNPLLLTILALIKRQGVELPRSRIKLYDRYLETLIEAWNRASALDKTAGRESMDYEATLEVLGPLALRVREENPTAGLLPARQLQDWLTEYYMGEQWGMKQGPAREKARDFLESVHRYSNLLVERGEGQYGFIHLIFEEALAAYGLVREGQIDRNKTLAYVQEHLTDPAWRETILLSVGVAGLINRQPLVAGEIARSMLKMQCSDDQAGYNILLAGACLEDVGESGLGKAAANEIRNALREAMENRSLPPVVQRDAGFSLAHTGWVPKDLDEWVQIPAGEFLYGDRKERMKIEKPFAVQKYPVTNLQFKRFVDDDGYEQEEHWSNAGWAWRTGADNTKETDKYQKRYLERRSSEKRHEPFFWRDAKWNNPLAPVVGITYFEAEAYASWLTKQLGRDIRLPTEHEWEFAARGADGREYPWGSMFDSKKVNNEDYWENLNFELMSTTVVCQFTKGVTSFGVSDMAGNVWEWTGSWIEKEQLNNVLRGGSWSSYRGYVRCAYRGMSVSDFFSENIGFRLISSSSA